MFDPRLTPTAARPRGIRPTEDLHSWTTALLDSPLTTSGPPAVLSTTDLSADALALLVRRIAADPASWQTRVRFAADERWWVRLHGDDHVDIWLLTWVHDTGTDLHDHGKSAGAFTVVSGELEEVRPEPFGAALRSTRLHVGDTRTISPGVVHDVRSPSVVPAISIHAYSPPLREMTFYAQDTYGTRPTRTVSTATDEELQAAESGR